VRGSAGKLEAESGESRGLRRYGERGVSRFSLITAWAAARRAIQLLRDDRRAADLGRADFVVELHGIGVAEVFIILQAAVPI